MNPINPTNGGINLPIQYDSPLSETLGKFSGGSGKPMMTVTEGTSSIETEGLGAIPEEDPVRDDPLGRAVAAAFDLPGPAMPIFKV